MSVQQHYRSETMQVVPMAIGGSMPIGLRRDREEGALDAIASTLAVARGEAVCRDGDPADACYRIESGCVRVSRLLPDGRRHVVDFLFAGDLFGLAQGRDYDCTVEAICDANLTRYPRRRLEALAERDLPTCNMLRRAAGAALSAAQRRSMLLAQLSAEERLAAFLLDLAGRMGVSRRLPLPMCRGDIADYLGLTIETVSRTFTKFRTRGWIELRGSQDVTLTDIDQLADLSEGVFALAA